MGTKADPGPHDCYGAAEDDEPMFVLLARDPFAPDLVREWARMRRWSGGPEDEKASEALEVAASMDAWRGERGGEAEAPRTWDAELELRAKSLCRSLGYPEEAWPLLLGGVAKAAIFEVRKARGGQP